MNSIEYPILDIIKLCIKCGSIKNINEFSFRKDTGKYRNQCIKCQNKIKIKWEEDNPEKIKEKQKRWRKNNRERCMEYHKKWRYENPEYDRIYYRNNRETVLSRRKKYAIDNPEKIKNIQKRYRNDNKEKIMLYNIKRREKTKEYNKQYRKTHINEIKETKKIWKNINYLYYNKYYITRRKEDISFKIAGNLRNRLNEAAKHNKKLCSAIKDMGCTVEFLKKHLEQKFYMNVKTYEIMAWDNYGTRWHIDHIIPLSTFDLTDENQFCRASHYSNLQPLWKEDNLEKKDSISWDWE